MRESATVTRFQQTLKGGQRSGKAVEQKAGEAEV